MTSYALQIVADHGHFRWVLLDVDGERILEHNQADCDFDSYETALNAGTLALAGADEQPYENEAADPVGDAACAAADQPPG